MPPARPSEPRLRRDLVEVCRRLHDRHLLGAGEGNVSCRLGKDRLLVTPSGAAKGFLRPGDLVVVDLEGRVIRGRGRPSTELAMHLAAYAARPDVEAVVHAHPLTAIAFTVAGLPPPDDLLPEAVLVLGPIGSAPFATPGTAEVPRSLAPLWKNHQVVLLERHGALALGRDLFQALDRMETLERVCEVAAKARSLGRCEPLPDVAVQKVLEAGRALAAAAVSARATPRAASRRARRG
ncbi:MAG TPA: class II aldolase/adducin family protein [Anaeromyxobacteraceae bacterium]|nr:class II aldolase/adducin family protein [Anaeromyxobacteraceae bacterium]